MKRARFGVLLLALSIVRPAGAQTKVDDLKKVTLDLSVPDIPTFTALGVSPSTVSRPTNVKELALALSNGINRQGQLQGGLALELSPAKLLDFGPELQKVLGGLRLSAGTNATSDAAGNRMALGTGVRWSLFMYQPEADEDLSRCVLASLPEQPSLIGVTVARRAPDGTTLPTSGWRKHTFAANEDCQAAFRAAHLASTGVELAGVYVADTVGDAKLSNLDSSLWTAWLSFSYGFNTFKSLLDSEVDTQRKRCAEDEECKQLGASAQKQRNWDDVLAAWQRQQKPAWRSALGVEPLGFVRLDRKRIGASQDYETDLYLAGRVSFITDGWTAFAEGGYKRNDVGKVAANKPDDALPLGLGADLRLSDGTWLGAYFGADALTGAILSLANLKWSTGDSRPF